jgi:hypothetical protein
MNGALMIRWGQSIPGREAASLDVFGSVINWFESLAKGGRIHSHHEYFSVTGRFGGFAILEGELEELTKILAEEDTQRINDKAGAVVQDYEIQTYFGGTDQTIQQGLANYTTTLHDLGYM